MASFVIWLPPLLSFGGAALGAWLVYRTGRTQEWGRRFQSALDLLASSDPRQRAFGRARIIEICGHGSADSNGRKEALAILAADVRATCSEPVRKALLARTNECLSIWISEEDTTRLGVGDDVFVARSLFESAQAYVEIAGGPDAAADPLAAMVSQAAIYSPTDRQDHDEAPRSVGNEGMRPLPHDRRLILVKLSPDAISLDPLALLERTRKAWRLSLDRVKSEPPEGVAAVVKQQVVGAWEYKGVVRSDEAKDRVEFVLGEEMPALIGREYRDTGQNPVRYWP